MASTHPSVGSARALSLGPFSNYIDGFFGGLESLGYTASALCEKRMIVAELSRWFLRRRWPLSAYDEDRLRSFLRDPRRSYRTAGGVGRTGRQLLDYLRSQGVLPPAPLPVRGPVDVLADEYVTFLRTERGLAEVTVAYYLRLVRPFLAQGGDDIRMWLDTLDPAAIPRYVLGRTHVWSVHHTKDFVAALRSFLRFLYVQGLTRRDLAPTVPTVPHRHATAIPKFLPAADVSRLLQACDRARPIGRRDFAILLLLARLGLRAAEVRYLTLDDVDWDAGELHIRSKGGHQDRIPLPPDVGQALAEYVRRDRPRCASRRLFIGAYAPVRGLGNCAVAAVVYRAIKGSGLRTPSMGPHMLRHSLATDILRRGGSLAEIAQLLRHGHPQTSTIYAKVDFVALREVSLPWPAGKS